MSPVAFPWSVPSAQRFHTTLAWSARQGPLPDKGGEWWCVDDDSLRIGWKGYAEYGVRRGPTPSAEATLGPIPESEAVVAFLLSVLPLALPLFDIEPLHASAVETAGGALVLLGARGSGKSSIASAMETRGNRLLADDCAAIDDRCQLWPGPPLLNPRWDDAQQPIVGSYNAKRVRFALRHSQGPHDVSGILVLEPSEGSPMEIQSLRATDVFVKLLGNVRAPDVFASRRQGRQLDIAASLSTLPAVVLTYDPASHSFDQVAEMVADRALMSILDRR